MQFNSTSDIKAQTWNIVVVGEAGLGKTTSLQNLDETTTLIIDIDKGLASLRHKNFKVWDVTKGANPKEKLEKFVEVLKYLRTEPAKKQFKTIVIDSITELGELMLNGLENDPEYSGKAKMLPRYGELGKNSMELMKILRDMPHYNKIYIALADREQDENGNFIRGISYPGKTSQKIPGYMDMVLYLMAEKDKDGNVNRMFLTENNGKIVAKDRSKKLSKFEPADIQKILEKINS